MASPRSCVTNHALVLEVRSGWCRAITVGPVSSVARRASASARPVISPGIVLSTPTTRHGPSVAASVRTVAGSS